MNFILYYIVLWCFSFVGSTQCVISGIECKHYYDTRIEKMVYTFTDDFPKFPNGDTSHILEYFLNNFKYPENPNVYTLTMRIEFVIDANGNILYPLVNGKEKELLNEIEIAALNVILGMPNWEPAKCKGERVPFLYRLPIRL